MLTIVLNAYLMDVEINVEMFWAFEQSFSKIFCTLQHNTGFCSFKMDFVS